MSVFKKNFCETPGINFFVRHPV